MLRKTLIHLILFSVLLCFTSIHAAIIRGTIIHATDKTPITGANIVIASTNMGSSTNNDGEFAINNIPPGNYELIVNHIGFKVAKQNVNISTHDVQVSFTLYPRIIEGQQITVSALRAENRKSPVAFTDLTEKEIDDKYWAQEIPLLLNDVPGVYAYSYTGSGLGYSEVKMRGFDATRVGVTLNDVPLNDPLDHITYFYDLPDISANVQDIQVQRGVANSLYGTGALAGSVNIRTESAGNERYLRYTAGTGSYNTRKHTIAFGSGLVDNTYSFYGRFSKVKTDGYRDNSWVDSWSYFFSASRYDENFTTTVNLFGGPMKAHFAWEGITKEELESNRRLNYDTYKGAADSFNQPQYQLINEWTPTDNFKLTSTLFHVKGDGYYEQLKSGENLTEYNMSEFSMGNTTISETDLVRQKWVDKSQYGWIPRIEYIAGRNNISMGGEFSIFKSHHWGEVIWANQMSPEIQPGHIYYKHNIDKNSVAVYINDLFEITPDLFLKADLQFQHIAFEFDQEKIGSFYGHNYELNYNFLTPRLGLNYNINKQMNIFGNFSVAKREPKDGDIYDADDTGAIPLFRTINLAQGIYEDPYIDAETLYDFESGFGYEFEQTRFKLNAYWMDFRNEIVATGGITDDGYPIYGNAEKSVHRGIEVEMKHLLPAQFLFSLNGSYNDSYFVDYIEYLWNKDYSGNIQKDRSGNTIASFPKVMMNAGISKSLGPISASLSLQHVGKIFLDNSQNNELAIDPHNVVNFTAHAKLPHYFGPLHLSLSVHVNNLLDEKYELSGYTWDGLGYYIPAAERNFFVSLQSQL